MINNRPLLDYVMTEGEFKNTVHMSLELGISVSSISSFYRNAKPASGNFILAVMRYLGTPISVIDDLLGSSEIKNAEQKPRNHHPHVLLDELIRRGGLVNDNRLAKKLLIARGDISKFRSNKANIGCGTMLKISEAFDMPVAEIKKLIGENK